VTAIEPSNSAGPVDAGADRRAVLLFWGLAAALLPAMVLASFHFGVTWDEKSRHHYGELIWDFYTGVRGREAFPETGGHLYGGLFDLLAVAAEHVFPGNRYVIRHVIGAIFGWFGIVYAGRLAGRFFGAWSAVITLALLTLSPRFFADAMNNPKDLPFAAMSVVALYYISLMSPRWPYLSLGTGIKMAVPLALALSIRAGALLYAGYAGMLAGAFFLAERQYDWRRLLHLSLRLLGLLAAVLVMGTVAWPWAQENPFIRPIIGLLGFSSYDYGGMVLFRGVEYVAFKLPWTYVPTWLAISTPPVVLLGVLLSLAPQPSGARWPRAALWFVVLLPIAMIVLRGSTIYDGIRHLLFTYPPLVILAASGYAVWLSPAAGRGRQLAAGVLLAVGLADIAIFNVRAFPNQIVYFNQVAGGPKGAFLRYDMDYWGNCLLEAVDWSAGLARRAGQPVVVSGNAWQIIQLDAERYKELAFTPPWRPTEHVTIRLNRGPIEGMRELVNRTDALYQVKTPDGVVLCAVFPGPAYDQLRPSLARAER